MARAIPATVFQFHSGSIKSGVDASVDEGEGKFQFHSGSIKSKSLRAKPLPIPSFNSIVVRLKVGDGKPFDRDRVGVSIP